MRTKSNYKAWTIDPRDYPTESSLEKQIQFIARYGVLAPSTHNTQPWVFDLSGNKLSVSFDQKLRLNEADSDLGGAAISIGACVQNIAAAASVFGLGCKIKINDLGAILVFEKSAGVMTAAKNNSLLNAIVSRHSSKQAYAKRSIQKEVFQELSSFSTDKVGLYFLKDQSKEEFIGIHKAAIANITKNEAFARELSKWLRNNATRKRDGMPGSITGATGLQSLLFPKILSSSPKILSKAVELDGKLLEHTPAIMVFTSRGTGTKNLVKAGMKIEEIWLALTSLGLVAHPIHATVQDVASRAVLSQLLKTREVPIFVMRIGYEMSKSIHSPRKDIKWS